MLSENFADITTEAGEVILEVFDTGISFATSEVVELMISKNPADLSPEWQRIFNIWKQEGRI